MRYLPDWDVYNLVLSDLVISKLLNVKSVLND